MLLESFQDSIHQLGELAERNHRRVVKLEQVCVRQEKEHTARIRDLESTYQVCVCLCGQAPLSNILRHVYNSALSQLAVLFSEVVKPFWTAVTIVMSFVLFNMFFPLLVDLDCVLTCMHYFLWKQLGR